VKIPILTYQPMHIDGNDYRANDLKALASDLRQLTDSGFKIVPLRSVVDAWLDNRGAELDGKLVALASDNGADFDYMDLPHPTAGTQRSAINILRDFAAGNPDKQEEINITSFVIASPEARAALDSACMIGKGWWTDAWWPAAAGSGLMHIGNHSWDHHHEALPASFSLGVPRGTFLSINSKGLADHEIRRAAEYLREQAPNPGTALFAYPYGEANSYLTRDYFPCYGAQMGIKAAFIARAGFLEPGTGRWEIPRFICGRDWTSPAELQAILDAAAEAQRVWVPVRQPGQVKMSPPGAGSASNAGAGREFHEFLASRVESIPGWLHTEAALLTAHLAHVQHSLQMVGPTLEIGVFKGKYLSVLYKLSRPDEIVVGVDFFAGFSSMQDGVDIVRANIAEACGDQARLRIVVADSMQLTSDRIAEETGGAGFRFISIDGGHTRELVLHDLELAYPLLQRGGIIALDDAFNYTTPGVIEGIAGFFLRHKPELAPFALCYNKMFVTTPDFHARYLRETSKFLDEASWLPTQERTLDRRRDNQAGGFTPAIFGYEVIPFL
jgi:peptidoglycan/xylan/chitin deacetylase (PgdA/CDA1 family)